jgi:hypothetical protein
MLLAGWLAEGDDSNVIRVQFAGIRENGIMGEFILSSSFDW